MSDRAFFDLGAEQLSTSEILGGLENLTAQFSNFDDAIAGSRYRELSPDVHNSMVSAASSSYPLCSDLLKQLNGIPDSDAKDAAVGNLRNNLTNAKHHGKINDSFFLTMTRGSMLLKALISCLQELQISDPRTELQVTVIETQINLLSICERVLEFDGTRMNLQPNIIKFIDLLKLPTFISKINGLTLKIFLSYVNYIATKGAEGLSDEEIAFLSKMGEETVKRNTIFELSNSSPANVNAIFSGTPNFPLSKPGEETPSLQKTPEYMDAILDFAIEGTDFAALAKALGMTLSGDPVEFIRFGEKFINMDLMVDEGQAEFEDLMKRTGISKDRLNADIMIMHSFFENYRQLIGQITSGTLDDVFKNIITSHAYVYTILMMLNGM